MYSASGKLMWLDPSRCDPPHRPVREEQVVDLANAFLSGWGANKPALVGYEMNGRIQLLSGSHRHAASLLAGIRIPVVLKPLAVVESAWGDLDAWAEVMRDESVS